MTEPVRFPFLPLGELSGESVFMPLLPISLRLPSSRWIQAQGLLDTGATVNVLPFGIGLQLGAVWERQETPVRLTGNLGNHEARALLIEARVANFAPVRLIFAWTRLERAPMLLG